MFFKKKEAGSDGRLLAVQTGLVVPVSEVDDPVFAQSILGGGVAIRPEGNEVLSPASGRIISVQDTGKGIPADEIDKITKPFYMVDKSRSRKEGGAGLGMSLCYEILRLHHAQWHIESELHVGTTITITIPQTGKE